MNQAVGRFSDSGIAQEPLASWQGMNQLRRYYAFRLERSLSFLIALRQQ
jgi:hypothetical protein